MIVFQTIRINARRNLQTINHHLYDNYVTREKGKAKAMPSRPICLFCAADKDITAEHVLPKWVFEKNPHRFFTTQINNLSHKYISSTIPVCATCNNDLLSELEKKVQKLFLSHQKMGRFFNEEETEDIIRWLEILDYKYQAFSLMTKFSVLKRKGPIDFLTDYSLSVLDPNIEYSPRSATKNIREALARITVKSKQKNLYSLVIFKTHNPDFYFSHKNNDFLFLDLPRYNLALFYFYKKLFAEAVHSKDAAMEILSRVY